MKQEPFLKINYQLFEKGYSLVEATIISYLKSFQDNGKYYFNGQNEIAKLFNIPIITVKREIKSLIDKKVIFLSQDKKYIQATFNNRKAIILVDDKNPLPIAETIPTKKAAEVAVVQSIITEEVIIPELESKICLAKEYPHLTSSYWQEDFNTEWLLKYIEEGYQVRNVTEAILKRRIENYKEKFIS